MKNTTDAFPQTEHSRIRRIPERGAYSRETIYPIIDEAPICHVGIIDKGMPVVIPMIHGRVDDTIYLHGAKASRILKQSSTGIPVCVTATLYDGLVLARSLFHHSMNYRSAVVYGTGRQVVEKNEKLKALEAISEHLLPGRWAEARGPNRKEMDATAVVAVEIESASAKTRTGPPVDDEEDYALPIWAGVLPMQTRKLDPVPDPLLRDDIPLSPSVAESLNL